MVLFWQTLRLQMETGAGNGAAPMGVAPMGAAGMGAA